MVQKAQTRKPPTPKVPKNHKLGQFVRGKDGAVTVQPPEESQAPQEAVEESRKTVVTTEKGVIAVKVEGDQEAQQVYDKESEQLSQTTASVARKDNEKRAKEAQVATPAKKLKTGSVVAAGTIEDIDISEYDKDDEARSKAGPADEDLVELVETEE